MRTTTGRSGASVSQRPSLSSGSALTSVPIGSSAPPSSTRVRSTAAPHTCGATCGGGMYPPAPPAPPPPPPARRGGPHPARDPPQESPPQALGPDPPLTDQAHPPA